MNAAVFVNCRFQGLNHDVPLERSILSRRFIGSQRALRRLETR